VVEKRGSIVDALAGKRIFLTGVTGFLGQVILERILLDLPDTQVTVLVRGQQSSTAVDRVHYLTRKPAFDHLKERVGGDDALLALLDEKVDVIEGDFSRSEPEIPAGMDVVIHSAAAVSFDPPIDEGFQTNLLGARNLYRAATAHNTPHLVHVSTAYVAGVQKGVIPEGPLDHKIDYELEAKMALQAHAEVEAQTRKPEMLEHFMAKAAKEHSRAGPSTVSTDAEERRKSWVDKRLIEYGRMRARTLGWPDVYTFTKAMGERAVEDLAHERGLSLSIVRPSIIESALAEPTPGWIRGFRMAEPVIISYARGLLRDFPGLPLKTDLPGRPNCGRPGVRVVTAAEPGRLSFGSLRERVSVPLGARGLSIFGLRKAISYRDAVECAAAPGLERPAANADTDAGTLGHGDAPSASRRAIFSLHRRIVSAADSPSPPAVAQLASSSATRSCRA